MISIAVFVGDEDYAAGLEKYLSTEADEKFSYGVYTRREGFEKYVREYNPAVIVAEESYVTEEVTIPCIALTHKGDSAGQNEVGMYKSLESVAKEIIDKITAILGIRTGNEERDASAPGENEPWQADIDPESCPAGTKDESADMIRQCVDAQITCICSPVGGIYASTFAYALALYHSKGSRTLFISYDPFFSLRIENLSEIKGGLGKLIYLLDRSCESAIDRCTQRVGGLDCICGADHWTDICDMKEEHAKRLLTLINKENYKNVVFDIKLFGAASVPLLGSSGRILVPCPQGGRDERIVSEWKRQLGAVGIDDRKVICIEVPYDSLVSKTTDSGMLLKGRLGRFIEETEGKRYVR